MTAPADLQHARVTLVLDRGALRRARNNAGLSLRQVGDVVGRHKVTIGKYEDTDDGIDPPASVLGALAGLYRVDVGTFFAAR